MVSCNEYDYVEIVCMYNYQIKLTMKSGECITCIALDTQYNEDREECIKVKHEDTETCIALNSISILEITVKNPHFKTITFN